VLLFLTWVVPLILGVTLVSARATEGAYSTVLALSPVAGLSLTCGSDAMFLAERMRTIPGMPEIASADLIRLAAIGPVLSFASVFSFLLVAVQRRFDQAVRNAMKAREDTAIAKPHAEFATAPEG
jgi:hypothetical protein